LNSDSNKTPVSKNDSKAIDLFQGLTHFRTIFLEGDKVLIENDSILYFFICIMFLLGVGVLFFSLLNISTAYKIVIGLTLVFTALLLILRFDYYSVLDLSDKSFHREIRISSLPIFKGKSINLADITELATDHKRELAFETKIPLFISNFINITLDVGVLRCLLKGKNSSSLKEPDKVDGMVVKSAIAYLSKNGQIGYLNSFSGRMDADKINSELVEILGIFTNKPTIAVDSNVGLSVKKIGNKFILEPYKLKPVMIGGGFAETVIILSILFLIVFAIFILVYFEIL
jgi:hypothetical protein